VTTREFRLPTPDPEFWIPLSIRARDIITMVRAGQLGRPAAEACLERLGIEPAARAGLLALAAA